MIKDLIFFEFGPGVTMNATDVYNCAGMTVDQLDQMAYELAIEQAETYGTFYYEGDEPDEDEDTNYIFTDSDLHYTWEPYDPKKHDMLRAGGGSFLDQFKE